MIVSWLFLSLTAMAQTGPSGAEAAVIPPAGVPAPEMAMPPSTLMGLMEPFEYDPRGRRDPFMVPSKDNPLTIGSVYGPLLPLQKYKLSDLKLTGVIWDVSRPKAMIQDPDGKVHVVGLNTKLGLSNGYIAVIREGEMVVVETVEEEGRLLSSARVVRISSSKQ